MCVVLIPFVMVMMAGRVPATEPPRFSDLVVDPAVLMIGTGEQQVTISLTIIDIDAVLDPASVRLKKVRRGKKNPTVGVFADEGQQGDAIANDGRYTTQIPFDTSVPRQRTFRIKAMDRAGNNAAPISLTIAVGPPLGLSSASLPSTLNLELERGFPQLTFGDPVALVQPPDADTRWFLVERTGIIQAFVNQASSSDLATALDLRDVVEPVSELDLELGMLAMAFHPNFAKNGEIYVYYTAQTNNVIESRLSRFISVDQGVTFDPDSEDVLLRVEQPRNRHNGGQLAFGTDGLLYLSLGDGGDRFQNQDTESLLGTMLRLDVDNGTPYAIPSDNPSFGNDGASEIYAIGFRNPWRWSFDSRTGVLW